MPINNTAVCWLVWGGVPLLNRCHHGPMRGERQEFDWQSPRLCEADLHDEAGLDKLCFRLVVTEGFLRVLARNEKGQQSLQMMSTFLLSELDAILAQSRAFSPTAKVSLQEFRGLCKAFLMLLGHPQGKEDPLTEMKARPAFNVIKNFLAQSVWWRELEKKCRQQAVAIQTFLPEIDNLEAELRKDVLATPAQRILERIMIWDEALPRGDLAFRGRVGESSV